MKRLTDQEKRLIFRLCFEDQCQHRNQKNANGLNAIIAEEFGIELHYVSRIYRQVLDSFDVPRETYKSNGVSHA